MKRTLKYALSAILTAAIVLPAVATTDNFPDVPDNHWAFEALQRLKKDGLLVGYPDGLFRGNRPASRYELAVAIHACYTNLKSVTDGLDSQIKALSDKLRSVQETAYEKGKAAAEATDDYVHANPWQAISAAVLFGAILGFMSRSPRR